MSDGGFLVGLTSLGGAGIAEMKSRDCEDAVHEKRIVERLSRHLNAHHILEVSFVDEGSRRGYVPLVQELQLRERKARFTISRRLRGTSGSLAFLRPRTDAMEGTGQVFSVAGAAVGPSLVTFDSPLLALQTTVVRFLM